METVNVLVAAAGSWVFGAIWYMSLAKPWMAVAGIEADANGRPVGGGSALPFLLSAICMVLVAGLMRYFFALAGIETVMSGLLHGGAIGLFFIAPWTMINNAYGMRPFMLTVIDGGYALIGCAIIGAILTLF
jgi:hypothetical protein